MNKIKFIYDNGETKTFEALAKLCDTRLNGKRPVYVEWDKLDAKLSEEEYYRYIHWIEMHVMCMLSALVTTTAVKTMMNNLINKLECAR